MNATLIDSLRIEASHDRPFSDHRSSWRVLALLLSATLLAGTVGYALRPGPLEVEMRPVDSVDPVEPAEIEEVSTLPPRGSVLDASGYVVARRQATVASELTARLREVNVEEGRTVAKGEVLARLDDATAQAQLALIQARLLAARSALEEISVQLKTARRALARERSLVARKLSSESALDRAVTEVDILSARLASHREQVRVVEREVELQRLRIEELIIRAPFSGVIIARAAQAGEIVSPVSAGGGFTRTGICTIVDMDSLEIEVDVNEAYIDRVRPGQAVVATLDAYPDLAIASRVKKVVPTADRQKATVRVRVELLDQDPRVLPEMGVSVRFLESAELAQQE